MNRDEFKEFLIDPSVDYRRELSRFRVNGRGDLLFMQNNRWEIMISHERLTECDWISHMVGKSYVTFGEFVAAYLKALERVGIRNLNIAVYGFDDSFKFADE